MRTAAEGRRERKILDRARALQVKNAARAKVKELRAAIRRAHALKKTRIREARAQCVAHRKLVIKRAKARYRRLLDDLRATTKGEIAAARARWTTGKAQTRESALSDVAKAAHALQHERAYQRELARIEANNRAARLNLVRSSKKERREESAGEVATNIPDELRRLWERVKGKIKGSTRQSRTEAFLHYAQEHPHEIVAAQERGVEATICELERRMGQHEKLARKRRYTAAELAEVPF